MVDEQLVASFQHRIDDMSATAKSGLPLRTGRIVGRTVDGAGPIRRETRGPASPSTSIWIKSRTWRTSQPLCHRG
jgi:hypothetical protein